MSNQLGERAPLVIVVNDDCTQLKTLALILKGAGYRAHEYSGAEAALHALSEGERPDLIVTDIHMPNIDGWHFCRLLRSADYKDFNATPILVVSATFAGDEVSRITTDLGANAFLAAPVDGHRFIACVRMLIKGEKPISKAHVLVAEDSDTLLELLKRTFAARQYEVHTAQTGRTVQELLRTHVFDVAVLDYHLPDMDSDTLLDEIKSRYPDTVCIMMTADRRADLALNWIKRGAAGHLVKPFSPEYLLRICDDARKQRALMRVPDLLEERTRKLSLAEERFRKVFEGLGSIAIQGYNADGTVFYWNQASEKLYGYAAEEAIGQTLYDLIIPESRKETVQAHIEQMLQTGHGGNPGEIELRRKDGFPVHIYSNHVILHSADGLEMFCIDIDLTERKRYEAMALQAEKMATLGTLVAGMAHEINNPNAFITLNAPLLKDMWQSITPILDHHAAEHGDFQVAGLSYHEIKDQIPELFHGVEEGASRIRQIVDDLKAYARAEPQKPRETVVIKEIAEASIRLLRPMIKKSTRRFAVQFDDFVPPVQGNGRQLGQVIVNLISNACEALSDSSKGITVRIGWRPDKREVYFEVTDEGEGMPASVIAKILDPFYTTKGASGGTGLGLAISHGIVTDHGGTLQFQSQPGIGTTATMALPVTPERESDE